MTLKEFIDTQFTEESRPDPRTVKGWIKDKKFPFFSVEMGDNRIFIDPEKSFMASLSNLTQSKDELKNPKVIKLYNKIMNHVT